MFGSRKFEVIKNGIDYSKYQFDIKFREKCRSQLLLKDEMLIGVIGRLVKLKNPYFVIEVLEKVLEKNPNKQRNVLLICLYSFDYISLEFFEKN